MPVLEKELHNQDLIRFGKVEFIFHDENQNDQLSSTTFLTDIIDDNCEGGKTVEEIKKMNPMSEKEQKLKFLLLTLLIVFGGSILILVIFAFIMLSRTSFI